MTLAKHLEKDREAIAKRWLDLTLGTYARETARFLQGESNPFANPVGQVLASELRALTDAVLDGSDPERLCEHLEGVIEVRAFQGHPPSRVLSFVFLLKRAIRERLGSASREKRLYGELAELEARVDQLALFGLDIYTKTRDRMWQLRIDEVKRSVSGVLRRIDWIDTGEADEAPGDAAEPSEPNEDRDPRGET